MPVSDICVRDVAIAERSTTVLEAAHRMRTHHVGNLVVVERHNGRVVPVGIITDRDIVLSVVAMRLDTSIFTVGDMVMQKVATCREDLGVFECIQQMRAKGIRRMPVVDSDGALVGIVSVDDFLKLLAVEMNELGKLLEREQAREVETRR